MIFQYILITSTIHQVMGSYLEYSRGISERKYNDLPYKISFNTQHYKSKCVLKMNLFFETPQTLSFIKKRDVYGHYYPYRLLLSPSDSIKTEMPLKKKVQSNYDSLENKLPNFNVFLNGEKFSLPLVAPPLPLNSKMSNDSWHFHVPNDKKITIDHFNKIMYDIVNNFEHIRVLVPGGMSGPLNKYFHRTDPDQAKYAYNNGVVQLSSGIFVSLKTLISIVEFYRWFYINESNSKFFPLQMKDKLILGP